jgi:putative hydrolase of the HAD superfamily
MNRHFIFDIGNVLIDFDLRTLQERVAAACGVSFESIREGWISPDFIDTEKGRMSGRTFFRRYVKSLGLAWTYEEWIEAWMDIYTPNQAGQRLLRDLKQRGCPVHVLSNLAEYNTVAIEEEFPGLLDLSDRRFFSYELGLRKPDLQIFKMVARTLNTHPSQCLFFDDMPENVDGAKAAGMQAMCFSLENMSAVQRRVDELLNMGEEADADAHH